MYEELSDLTGIHLPPLDPEDMVDHSRMRDWFSDQPPLEDIYTLPAQGLDNMERDRFGFHVVNADANSGFDLTEALGKSTLIVDGAAFHPDHVIHKLDVLSQGGREPVRVVFRNLGGMRHGAVHEIEKFFDRKKGFPIKAMYFIDEGDDIDEAVRGKLLMRCDDLVDSATLLDAAAFGWGARNPYSGAPVGGPDYTDGGEQAFMRPGETLLDPTAESLDVTFELDNEAIRLHRRICSYEDLGDDR
jgi:hypothetical protein